MGCQCFASVEQGHNLLFITGASGCGSSGFNRNNWIFLFIHYQQLLCRIAARGISLNQLEFPRLHICYFLGGVSINYSSKIQRKKHYQCCCVAVNVQPNKKQKLLAMNLQ